MLAWGAVSRLDRRCIAIPCLVEANVRVRVNSILFVVVVLVAGACSGDSTVDTTAVPTTTLAPTTTVAPTTTSPTSPPTTTAAPEEDTGELTATLLVGDGPLAGVQVFLGINAPSTNADVEARFACSDDEGVVRFSDVPLDTPLIAVTGPGVNAGCSNSLFVDPEALTVQPLATTLVLTPGETIDGDTDLGSWTVSPLPGGLAVAIKAIGVIISCLGEGDFASARGHFEGYEKRVEEQRTAGNLTPAEVDLLDRNAESLRFTLDSDSGCPGDATLGPLPDSAEFDWAFTPEGSRPTVTLIEPGAEPREVRAYDLTPGDSADTSMRLTTSILQEIDGDVLIVQDSTIDLTFALDVVDVFDGSFVVVTSLGNHRARASEPATQSALDVVYANLVGTSVIQLTAPTGEVVGVVRDQGPGEIAEITSALAGVAPPLPEEPIGIGAVWAVVGTIDALGVPITSTTIYTLTDIDGPLLTVEIVSEQEIDPDAGLFPELEDADVTLSAVGTGRAIWHLSAATPGAGSIETVQVLTVTGTFDGVESTFEQTFTATFELPGPAAFAPPEGTSVFAITDISHSEGDVAYEQDPPAGGAHSPRWQTCGFYDEPVRSEDAVHSLEHGAVWITYQPELARDQIEHLERLSEFRHTLVSPYPDLDSAVVASAWGVQLRLDSAFDPRLTEFIDWYAHGPQTLEPGAPCTNGIGDPR